MFYKRKSTDQVEILDRGNTIELSSGDSFGLLPDLFWFVIRDKATDESPSPMVFKSETHESSENATTESNGSSTVTEERFVGFSQENSEQVPTEDVPLTPDGLDDFQVTQDVDHHMATVDNNETATDNNEIHQNSHHQLSTNGATSHRNSIEPVAETADVATNYDTSEMNDASTTTEPVTIKQEPHSTTEETGTSDNLAWAMPRIMVKREFKTEIKDEPMDSGDGANCSTTGDSNQPRQRICCRYGVRCYRYFRTQNDIFCL